MKKNFFKNFISACLAIILFSSFGCGLFSRQVSQGVPQTVRGQVISAALIPPGANVLIVPFSPGPMVVASDEIEHISLRLVKGMSEEIENSSDLKVLAGSRAQEAQVVIKGRIKRICAKKYFWFFGQERAASLMVEGEAISRPGGQPIAHFTATISRQDKGGNFEALAEQLGRDIGTFFAQIGRA